jgi:hypothetical protein
MRPEGHSFFRNLAHGAQAENLKATAIGQDTPFIIHKLMQPTRSCGSNHYQAAGKDDKC